MRLPVLLALGLLVSACSSGPEWISSSNGSLCTFDASGRVGGTVPVDVVIVVDDSPSAAPSRPMLRARTLAALRGLVTETDPNDWTSRPALHDLHVLVRGAATSYERRVAYLSNTPDNAWKTPQDESRDIETFLAACESALADLPEGTEEHALVARVSDLRLGEGFLRTGGHVVVLFATAHDDSSEVPTFAISNETLVALSVLVDDRLLGSTAPAGARSCGTFARETAPEWDPARTSVPRLAALVRQKYDARLSIVCSDSQEVGNLLRFFESFVDYGCLPPLPAECTLLVVPPVLGDDTRCERPELGLVPATASERRYAESRIDVQGRPLCRMHQLESAVSQGEGWYLSEDACRPRYTAWAQPAGGSYLLLHCEGPKCVP